MNPKKRRLVIIGGVAAGASCATRARRLCESCEIILIDKGAHVSFANCGLPYFVGDVIPSESSLLVATPALFKNRFNIEVWTETEVSQIDRAAKTIEVRDLRSGEVRHEAYDALVIATGARPIRPPLPGIDLPGIQVLRTIPDSRRLKAALAHAKRAVLVGGGFIGLELAENLVHQGLHVTLLEREPQIMPPLDKEMACYAEDRMREQGVELRLGEGVAGFQQAEAGGLMVQTGAGAEIPADIVILGMGVRPETTLAQACGLELGALGGIRVDETLRTSDPAIWAAGDVVEVKNLVTDDWQLVPLAGPANRQGRIVATNILRNFQGPDAEAAMTFKGIVGTAVCEIFGLTVAMTGASEKLLKQKGITDYQKVYLHPGHHASYFPGAKPIHLKLLFSTRDGRVLGAQGVGEAEVARRIDVIATVLMEKATVFDLEELELCYAPQFGAAKDPVNIAGMLAANHLRGDLPLADWAGLSQTKALVLDVRSAAEFERGHIPEAWNIPLEELRGSLSRLPKSQEIWLVCGVGQRAYYANRILLQNGFKVRILSGGMQTYQTMSLPRMN